MFQRGHLLDLLLYLTNQWIFEKYLIHVTPQRLHSLLWVRITTWHFIKQTWKFLRLIFSSFVMWRVPDSQDCTSDCDTRNKTPSDPSSMDINLVEICSMRNVDFSGQSNTLPVGPSVRPFCCNSFCFSWKQSTCWAWTQNTLTRRNTFYIQIGSCQHSTNIYLVQSISPIPHNDPLNTEPQITKVTLSADNKLRIFKFERLLLT